MVSLRGLWMRFLGELYALLGVWGDLLPVIVSQIHTLSFRNFDRDHFDRGSSRGIS